MRTSISSLASSFPGQACTPLPNGRKVFGRGATCIHKQPGEGLVRQRIVLQFFFFTFILQKWEELCLSINNKEDKDCRTFEVVWLYAVVSFVNWGERVVY
jgi:hypothetical protein